MPKINQEEFTIVVRNRITRTIYSIEKTTDPNRVYQVQDEYLGKFWIKVEVERWDQMPKINQEEYEILKELIGESVKWICRDEEGGLFVHGTKPNKGNAVWLYGDGSLEIRRISNSDLFQFIQWEDPEPYNISELIEEYEIKELRLAPSRTVIIDSFNESEETEVKKDIEWLNNEVEKRIKKIKTDEVSFAGSDYFDEGYIHGMRDVQAIANQLDEPEVLSQDWIENKTTKIKDVWNGKVVSMISPDDLKGLLVPKQEEITEEQAWKVIHGKYGDEVLQNNIDYVESQGYVVNERPTIPQFIADYLPLVKQDIELEKVAYYAVTNNELAKWEKEYDWIRENFEAFVRAWLAYPNIEAEAEQKYYARIKGWENVTTGSEAFNWVYFKEKDTVGISKAIENKYQAVSFTKHDWNNLGINEHNADFVLVEELEE